MLIAFLLATATTIVSPARVIDIDGDKVSYSVTRTADGQRRFFGERLRDGVRFEFVVQQNGAAKGYVGSQEVRFRAPIRS